MINEYGALVNKGLVKTKLFRENPATLPLQAPQILCGLHWNWS